MTEIEQLKQKGITAVLNLQSDQDLEKHRIDWCALQAHYCDLGIELRRAPILDYNRADLSRNLKKAVAALGELLDSGHTVFVHCNAGVNRSPTVVIAYLHWMLGWDLEEADRYVQERRCCIPILDAIRDVTSPGKHESD